MTKNLNKAFETENGIIVDGVVMPDSVVEATRSCKPTYSGDNIASLEYYNSLTQIDANRILKEVFTYTGDVVTGQVNTYYDTNGTTVLYTETLVYSYTSDVVNKVEVT